MSESVFGLYLMAYVLLAVLTLGLPILRPLALIWYRFWAAVIIAIYLGKPWRVARDRARREIV